MSFLCNICWYEVFYISKFCALSTLYPDEDGTGHNPMINIFVGDVNVMICGSWYNGIFSLHKAV